MKSFRNIATAATLAAATLFTGCATSGDGSYGSKGKREAITKVGYELDTINQNANPFDTEALGVEGTLYYMTDIDKAGPNQLPLAIYRRSDVMQETNLTTHETKFKPTTAYIPTREMDEITGEFVDGVYLKMTGSGGNRAGIMQYHQLGKRLETLNGFDVVRLDEDDAYYVLTTVNIPGFGKYFMVGDDTGKVKDITKELDYFMIPIEGTTLEVDYSNGRMALKNDDNVLRPIVMTEDQLTALHGQKVIGQNALTQTDNLFVRPADGLGSKELLFLEPPKKQSQK